MGKQRLYHTIVADPPWKHSLGGTWKAKKDKARPQRDYPLMEIGQIMDLQVPAARQSHLYLWAVAQHVDWAYEVASAWDFSPVILWTWHKSGLGVGRFQCNTEHVLVCRRGPRQGNPFGSSGRTGPATNGTCFDWPRGRASVKPKAFYDLVEAISPAPRLEMFARALRHGWDVWGNEVTCSVDILGARMEEHRE